MGLGYVEGVTHDYKRHGTTTLFAALNVLNGAVLAACKPRHRHQEFLSFLREIDRAMSAELGVHCIADNFATHSHPKIKAWLASRPRWHMHFIPTYSSWLNQVERFFSLITDKAIRRGSFTSVKQLDPASFPRTSSHAAKRVLSQITGGRKPLAECKRWRLYQPSIQSTMSSLACARVS